MLSFPEQMKQLQANTKLLQTKAQFAEPLAQANLTQEQVKANYAQPNAAADLLRTQLGNQTSQINLQTLPQMNMAALTQALIANQKGQIDLRTLPQLNQANLQRALLGNQESEINLKTLPEKNAADIAEQKARSQYYQMGGGSRGGVDQSDYNMMVTGLMRQKPELSNDQAKEWVDAYLEGSNKTSSGQEIPAPYGVVKDALESHYKHKTDSAERTQRRFASTLDTLFDEGDKIAPSAFKFTGAQGQALLAKAKANAAVGIVDPDFLQYKEFTTQFIPSMVTEMLKTGGANSTDTQKLLAMQAINPIELFNHPEVAYNQYKFVEGLYRKIGKNISKSSFDLNQNLRKLPDNMNQNQAAPVKNYSSILKRNVSEKDILDTAKEMNVSVEQVKADLGIS